MSTRREFFALAAAVFALHQRAAGQTTPERGIYRDYARCLPEFLGRLAKEAYDRRNRDLEKLVTPETIVERQQWVTNTFWELVGGMPVRTPLNARVTGQLERRGYRLEKVIYESQPNFLISGNLYLPTEGTPPYPGVLFQMGHSANGKAYVQYQRCCQSLARLGYVVLGFDPMGQGERTYYPGPQPFLTRLDADEEHTRPGRQMLLKGDTSTRLQTWDSVRSLDLLASHPLVDPSRLASTGQSGGGTNTMLLAAVDSRLTAAALSCPNTENVAIADFNSPGSTDDAEQNLVASAPVGFDRWDLLYPFAPKPLLIAVSERDFFGTYSPRYISNGLEEFRKLEKIYQVMGQPERIRWRSTPLPHGLSLDMRMMIYHWLERWMQANPREITEEPETHPEPDDQLFVSPRGSLVVDFGSETPFSINHKRTVPKTPTDLATLIGADPPFNRGTFTKLGDAQYQATTIDVVEFQSAPEVWVPAWIFQPRKADPAKPLLVVLHPSGRLGWRENDLYDELASAGCVVCAPDFRNQGDLRPEFGRGVRGHADLHNSEEHYAWSSLILGKPLLGQRVTDLLAVLQGLRARPELARRRVVIAALGFTTVPAIFTAAIDRGVHGLYLAGGLLSFDTLCAAENYTHPFGNFVPRLLHHTDLPLLAVSSSSTVVTVAGAVDGGGNDVRTDVVRQVYDNIAGNRAQVEILDKDAWRAGAILRSAAVNG
ncbi:MAG: acetylxylan esterase [Bryobacterales bacterium]|nr:acetylxylan esterase [Bryobacterales bacterium]